MCSVQSPSNKSLGSLEQYLVNHNFQEEDEALKLKPVRTFPINDPNCSSPGAEEESSDSSRSLLRSPERRNTIPSSHHVAIRTRLLRQSIYDPIPTTSYTRPDSLYQHIFSNMSAPPAMSFNSRKAHESPRKGTSPLAYHKSFVVNSLFVTIFILLFIITGLLVSIMALLLKLEAKHECEPSERDLDIKKRVLDELPRTLPSDDDKVSPYDMLLKQDLKTQKLISKQLMKTFNSTKIRDNIRWMSSKIHVAGTPEQLELMDRIEQEYKDLGFEVKSCEYEVLLSYPDYGRPSTIKSWNGDAWEELSNGLAELLGPPEAMEQQSDPRLRIWWNAYSAFGTAIGPIVYVNYGTDEDYTLLEEANIDLKGKIALLRYGGVFRGDKALLAEKRGAIGVIIYSDPYDYAPELHQTNKIFPDQIWLPPSGAQRGTLLRTTGDPETPFYPSKPYVYRTEQEEYLRKRNVLSSIPVLPIGYRDAVKIMAKLNGPEVQWNRWKGSMNTTYRVTGTTSFRLEVRGRTSRRPIKNVIAIFRGKEESDRWVMLGNHVDAWTKGAIDPNSGTGILLETARVVKEIHDKTGWRPRRSLVFCQWDAEEFGLIGSTEWVEEMLKPLQTHAVAYLNLDNVNGNNTLAVKSVPLLYRVLVDAASKIQHPNPFEINHGRNTLLDAWRFYNPKGPLPGDKSIPAINIPGSGSDFQRFISYAGVPIADLKMESQPVYSYMLYHTMYELPWTVENLVDPTGHVFESMGKFWLEVARNLADSLIIPFDIVDYAVMLEEFFKKMDTQLVYLGINQALSHEFYQEKMQYLHGAIERFQVAAIEIQNIVHAVNTAERSISLRQAEMLNSRLLTVEKAFILEKGIYSERSFFRHAVFSVSEHDIYSGVTFALIMDPAAEYENAKGNETIQEHWLETIKLGFMKLTYAIESATVVLDLNGF